MTFEWLIMKAVDIKDRIEVWKGPDDEAISINIEEIARKYHKCYCINRSVVAFVYRQVMYVIPFTKSVIDTLDKKGFRKADFFVPFSNGEVPKWRQGQWKDLNHWANAENNG